MVKVIRLFTETLRITLHFTRPLSNIFLSVIYRFVMGATRPLPPIKNEILLMSATELAEKIRKRQLKCEDVVQAYVQRSGEVHSIINAAVDERYESALKDARAVDMFLKSGERSCDDIAKATPLLGIPFSCKESIGVKGMAQTCGLVREKGRLAEKDSDAAALYKQAGAIPLTVTNVPELAMWVETANLVFGRTMNPYDNTREVGGSTGGEAAIISSAGAIIGIGSDLAGSLRIPASFCGIYGHKPTSGVVSNLGMYPQTNSEEKKKLHDFIGIGPMCRYAEDLPLLLRVLSNDDKRIHLSEKVDFKNVKIYYMEEFPGILHSSVPDVKNAIRKAANYFEEKYGRKPIPLKINELKHSTAIWECKVLERGTIPFKVILGNNGKSENLRWEFLKSLLRLSHHTWPALFYAAIERRKKVKNYLKNLERFQKLEIQLQEIFTENAILLVPTRPEPPPHYLMSILKYSYIGYTGIFNVLGLPVTQIPAGMSCGLPIGIQAISGQFKDHLTIAAAFELNKAFCGWKSPSIVDI